MQEHVGKKRRKEIRQAADLRKLKNKCFMHCFLVLGVLLILLSISTGLVVFGLIDGTSAINQGLLLVISFVGCIFVGNESSKAYDARKAYKTYCEKYEVTKEDIVALDNGEL